MLFTLESARSVLSILGNPQRRAWIVWGAVVIHVAACLGLLLVAAGTEAHTDMAARLLFVTQHGPLWGVVWVAWMFASASLLAFALAWSAAMADAGTGIAWKSLLPGIAIIGVGVLFDFAGELTLILATRIDPTDVDAFATQARLYQFLSPVIANGLYCIGGTLLSLIAWRCHWLAGWRGMIGFAMWLVGFGLTIAGILNHRELLAITGAGVMMLFIAFASLVAWKIRRTHAAA